MDNISVEIGVAVVAVLTAIASWFKSHSDLASVIKDREQTKSQRDQDSQQLHDKVIGLEFKYTALKDAQQLITEQLADTAKAVGVMNTQIAQMLIKMDNAISAINELKELKKNGRRSK